MRRDVLAAGARQPIDEPGVDELDIADRQQEERALERRRAAVRRYEGAEINPARPVAAAGERPAAAQGIATRDRRRLAGRGEAGAGEGVFVAAPHPVSYT